MQVFFYFSINNQINIQGAGIASGANILGVNVIDVLLQGIFGVAFLVISLLAWRGRPARMRFIMMVMVVGLMIYNLLFTILPGLVTAPSFEQGGIGSAMEVGPPLLWSRLFATVLIPLYVVWYMNRGPARAFYRGYYLPFDKHSQPAATDTPPDTHSKSANSG